MKETHYNILAKGLHWTSALIVLGLLPLGFYMVSLDFSPFKLDLYWWHKSFGSLLFFLVWLRLVWRRFNPPPPHIETHKKWERTLAKVIHLLLYSAMIGMPLSGLAMSAAADFPRPFFGLFDIPDFIPGKDDALFDLFRELHEIFAYMLVVGVGLHGLGALKHHVVDKDATMLRMLPRIAPKAGFILVLLIFVLTMSATMCFVGQHMLKEFSEEKEHAVQAQDVQADSALAGLEKDAGQKDAESWMIVKNESAIRFKVNVQGEEFQGQFNDFGGEIVFDPEALEESHVRIFVKTASVTSGSDERDDYMVMPPWFHSESFPESVFEADEFQKIDENQYLAKGQLTLRDATMPLDLPFTLKIERAGSAEQGEEVADMTSDFVIDRLAFGVGTGDWSDPKMVGNQVSVSVSLKAKR